MDRGQLLFLLFAVVSIGYQAAKGWRLGLVRQLVRFGSLIAAYSAAILCASATVPFLRPLGYPDFILRIIGGAVLFLVVYAFLSITGRILFKRTAHQDVGIIWFLYGASGALIGIVFGLVIVLFLADGIRMLGSIAEAGAANDRALAKAENPVLVGMSGLKRSIEAGTPGEALKTIDPVPKKVYSITEKLGRVVANSDSVTRFLDFPGAKELAARPEIQALHSDPEILSQLRDRHYLLLLKNEKIIKAANSPKVGELVKQFDVEKALDYALKK